MNDNYRPMPEWGQRALMAVLALLLFLFPLILTFRV